MPSTDRALHFRTDAIKIRNLFNLWTSATSKLSSQWLAPLPKLPPTQCLNVNRLLLRVASIEIETRHRIMGYNFWDPSFLFIFDEGLFICPAEWWPANFWWTFCWRPTTDSSANKYITRACYWRRVWSLSSIYMMMIAAGCGVVSPSGTRSTIHEREWEREPPRERDGNWFW